jgi:Rrf2 family protein
VIFSRKCEYAIRALTHLAQTGGVCGAREISRSQKAHYPFMAKVLQGLNRKGLVKSVKGARGGFILAKPPHCLRLMDVLMAVDGNQMLGRCLYGFTRCSDSAPCPLHEDWASVRFSIETYLRGHTLAQLAKQGSFEPAVKGRR